MSRTDDRESVLASLKTIQGVAKELEELVSGDDWTERPYIIAGGFEQIRGDVLSARRLTRRQWNEQG